MEEDSLFENKKFPERHSYLETRNNKEHDMSRFKKRLSTFTISTSLTGKNFSNKALKQIPQSRNTDKRKATYINLINYNKSINKIRNIKMQFLSNISPTISTFDNEKEITKSKIENENEKMNYLQEKIYKMYNSYYKAYKNNKQKYKGFNYGEIKTKNNNIKSVNHKTYLFPDNSPSVYNEKKNELANQKILSRSIETKSKTSKFKTSFQTTFNLQSPVFQSRKTINNLLKTVHNKSLREKVKNLVQEIDYKKKNEYIPRGKLKGQRVKLVSLLNKKKGIINEKIYYLSKKKITKSEHPMLAKKPTNNIEMNNLIINSFGFGHNQIEFSKKLYDLNEVFFSLIENMKKRRAEIDIARFEKEKRKYTEEGNYNDYNQINFELYFQRNNRDKWEKKFMLEQYKYKIPEKEFRKYKKFEKEKRRLIVSENAKKLSSWIHKLDSEAYESPDELTSNYRSTKNNISAINFKRISRVLKILKTNEDEEQTGNIVLKPDLLRKEQKTIENEMLNIIGKSGKPRFVKNFLKPKTVTKYKSISGNFFGLPV